MILHFPLVKITPTTDLESSFVKLGVAPLVERFYATMVFLDVSLKREIFNAVAIIDTGAIFSLVPNPILNDYPNLPTEPHNIWGIVNKEPCRIKCRLGIIPIQLLDERGMRSPILHILVAFADNPKVPILLGMKSLLAECRFGFSPQSSRFSLEIASKSEKSY